MNTETRHHRPPPSFLADFGAPLAAILDYPALARTIDAGLEAALDEPWLAGARRLVLAGSGDSLFAARSTLPALRRWSGIAAEVMTSLEFARYETPLLGDGDVLVAISNSGNSSRAREAVGLARDRGIAARRGSPAAPAGRSPRWSIAPCTARCDRRSADLGRHGRAILHMAEYLATLRTLYGLGLRLGTHRARLSEPDRIRIQSGIDYAIEEVPVVAEAAEPRGPRPCRAHARRRRRHRVGARGRPEPRHRGVLRGQAPRADPPERRAPGPRGVGAPAVLPDPLVG